MPARMGLAGKHQEAQTMVVNLLLLLLIVVILGVRVKVKIDRS